MNSVVEKEKNSSEPKSPCRKVCRLDEEGMCVGCFRMLDEIANWGIMTNPERSDILRKAHLRMQLRDLKL
ncbi:MAG: DUF1289 domain-containing protein [Bacteroidales bacterium]|nr:DUF1289 domain-containing protein [Bacteroidales bacterium]